MYIYIYIILVVLNFVFIDIKNEHFHINYTPASPMYFNNHSINFIFTVLISFSRLFRVSLLGK